MSVTKNLANYTRKKSINILAMSRATGISYPALYASLRDKNRSRELTVDEAMSVCKFLDVNLQDFADKEREVM